MRAAYLFHIINLFVSIMMVPILLSGLSVADYAIWLAFLVFGNATIQIQNAVQSVVIKDVARGYFGGERRLFIAARRRTGQAYLVLSALVLGPVMAGGLAYFYAIDASTDVSQVITAWVIFALAYALVYLCGPRNALLLGTGRSDVQNNINTLTRVVHLASVTAAILTGSGILGLSVAFAAATSLGSLLSMFAARGITGPLTEEIKKAADPPTHKSNILSYICFAVASYGLYNGMYLVVVAHAPHHMAASYGLGIQISTLLLAISTAPFNVWLGRLTSAVTVNDQGAMIEEVVRTFLTANLVLIVGFAGLLVLGDTLLQFIGTDMRLPSYHHLALFGVAFAVEANILVLVNYMMVRGDFGFVRLYVAGVVAGVGLGMLAARWTGDVYALLTVPILIQASITLPFMLRRARRTLEGSALEFGRCAVALIAEGVRRHRPTQQ